jgi:hypothetical protein
LSPSRGFLGFFLLTLVLLCMVVLTGRARRIRLHIALVAASLAALFASIRYALRLGDVLDLQSAGSITPIHLTIAKIATASYALPLVTGVMTLRNRSRRRAHLICAMIALSLTVAAAATGTLMWLLAEPAAPFD